MKKIFFFLICSALVCYGCTQKQSHSGENTLSDVEKILGLSICWAEAKYNFVYFDRITFDWDSLYKATIPLVLATKNYFEYYRELIRFVARLQDGHTYVWWDEDRQDYWNNWAHIPVSTRLIDGKMIVTGVHCIELEQVEGVKIGIEVVKINGIDVHEYVSTYVKPYIFSSTEQYLNFIAYGMNAMRGKITEPVRLTFKDENNRVFESNINRILSDEPDFLSDILLLYSESKIFDFSVLENNIGMLKINGFWQENFTSYFDAIYEKILDTDALIIDIRGNPGGNSNNSEYILSHLTNENFQMSAWSSRRYVPALTSWNRRLREWHIGEPWIGQPIKDKPFYSKPVAVLIDESTFSAAEDFCVGFRNMNRGLIIGAPSGGSTGNPIWFRLPGGGTVSFCSKKDTYPDGTEFVGVGILPDIEARESVSSFLSKAKTGIDNSNAARKAIEILKSAIEK